MPTVIPHVIAYHKIAPVRDIGVNTIDPERFENHIKIILDHGFNPVTFTQLIRNENAYKQPIVITFDDGYQCIHSHAFPILQKYAIPAVVFVVTNYIGMKNGWESFAVQRRFRHLGHEEIMELHCSGWEIGSHSLNHHYMPSLSEHKLEQEIKASKEAIEEILNENVISFCYPYGRYNNRICKVVRDAGYVFATGNIRLFKADNNMLCIKRRSIYSSDTTSSFLQKLDNSKRLYGYSHLKEWIIQRGTIPGITLNAVNNLKY